MDNRYEKGKIYKVVDVGYNMCYIGSTVEELSQRMARHRYSYKYFLEGKTCSVVRAFDIFDKFGVNNCKIELLELFPCASRTELEKREGEIIRQTVCVNKQIAGRTQREQYIDNRSHVLIKSRKYREEHSDDVKEKLRTYYAAHKEQYKQKRADNYKLNKEQILERNRQYHKLYASDIKLKREAYFKAYRENNREKLCATYTCNVCGDTLQIKRIKRHERTKKHIRNLENK